LSSICGTGVDTIEIPRIKKAYERWGEDFLEKIYLPDEIEYCLRKVNPYPSLAARFAAKEACFKALSQAGIVVDTWHGISVGRAPDGRPHLIVPEATGVRLHLSLSHSKEFAVAMVVVERD
jgi:holo-[acyl-carrier protein] synthase